MSEIRFACGSLVRYDRMFVFFALCERKKDKRKRGSTALPKARSPTAYILLPPGCELIQREDRPARVRERQRAQVRATDTRRIKHRNLGGQRLVGRAERRRRLDDHNPRVGRLQPKRA